MQMDRSRLQLHKHVGSKLARLRPSTILSCALLPSKKQDLCDRKCEILIGCERSGRLPKPCWLAKGELAAGRCWLTLSVPPSVYMQPVCVEAVSAQQTLPADRSSIQSSLLMGGWLRTSQPYTLCTTTQELARKRACFTLRSLLLMRMVLTCLLKRKSI